MRYRNRAFTLVELLVVIGIIGVLVAILLPVLNKVRRKALVLASPLACTSFDENRVHLIDPQGQYELALTPSYGWYHARRPTEPMWSPSGSKIAFTVVNYPLGQMGPSEYIGILDPMSGSLQQVPIVQAEMDWSTGCIGWYDEDHIIKHQRSTISVINIATGEVVNSFHGYHTYLTTVPRGLPGKWITGDSSTGVRFIKSDFSPGKPVWVPRAGDQFPSGAVDVDPLGEWAGWNVYGGTVPRIAYKPLAAPPGAPPYYLTISGHYFLQWTDDGHLLLSSDRSNQLTVVKRDGTVVRKIPLQFASGGPRSVAWRRYLR